MSQKISGRYCVCVALAIMYLCPFEALTFYLFIVGFDYRMLWGCIIEMPL